MITVIAVMPCKEYYVGTCTDVDKFIQEAKSKYRAGYFYQKRNKGQIRIVFSVPGDYTTNIKAFGARQFMEMMYNYEPLQDAIIQLLA